MGEHLNALLHQRSTALLGFASRYTIRQKLLFFSGSVLVLILFLLLSQIISQSVVRTASDKKEAALEIASLAAQRQSMAEAFRQSYDSAVVASFPKIKKASTKAASRMVGAGAASKAVLQALEKDNVDCNALFEEMMAAGFAKSQDLSTMMQALVEADKAVDGLLLAIETHEADLQMEGLLLEGPEAEYLNVARDGRIFFLTLKTQMDAFLAKGDDGTVAIFKETVSQKRDVLFKSFASFAVMLKNKDYEGYSEQFIRSCESFIQAAEKVFVSGKVEFSAYKTFAMLSRGLVQKSAELSNKSSNAAAIARGSALGFSLILSLVAAVLFLILSYSIIVSITKPMVPLKEGVLRIGQGDLTVSFASKGADEIAQISRNLDSTTEKLRGMIQSVLKGTSTLAASGGMLTSMSTQFVANAQDMNTRVRAVTDSTAQSNRNIQEISLSTQEMSEGVQSVALAIEQMSLSINDVARSCQKEAQIASVANEQAKATRLVMAELGEAAKTIGKVVNLISSIANKTNLLALNATIEAASAGEAGRGFAVVASEVKDLARQTAQATQDIRDQVNAIQKNTDKALLSIGSISEVVEEVNTISQSIVSAVEEQSATVKEVSNIVTVANNSAQIIAGNVNESAQGLALVSENINTIQSVSDETAKGLLEVRSSAEALTKLSDELKRLMAQFKV